MRGTAELFLLRCPKGTSEKHSPQVANESKRFSHPRSSKSPHLPSCNPKGNNSGLGILVYNLAFTTEYLWKEQLISLGHDCFSGLGVRVPQQVIPSLTLLICILSDYPKDPVLFPVTHGTSGFIAKVLLAVLVGLCCNDQLSMVRRTGC